MQTATQTLIKASDLRVGNYVLVDGKPFLIKGVVGDYITDTLDCYFDDESTKLSEAYPIQLTPELLEKCGFEYGVTVERGVSDKYAWHIQISNLDYLEYQIVHGIDAGTNQPTQWGEWRLVSNYSMYRLDFWNQPEYLHQLQNLFHSLTGEELTVNL